MVVNVALALEIGTRDVTVRTLLTRDSVRNLEVKHLGVSVVVVLEVSWSYCPNPLDFLPDSTPKNVVDDVAKATDKLDDAADAAKKIDQAGDIADAAGDAAKKKNIFQKGGDFLGNWWKTSGSKTLTNTVDAAKNLGSSLLKQIDALPSPLKLVMMPSRV